MKIAVTVNYSCMKKPLVATISKFPPYMSGHSFESMNQGRALYEITGYKHHEVTYHPGLYHKSTYFNNPVQVKEYGKYVYVQQVKPPKAGTRVLDGELIKSFIGETINLIQKKKVNVLSSFYIDPHAYIINQAKLYAEQVLEKKVITVQKAVGTDISTSIADHLEDGQGKFLLLQLVVSDLVLAVSEFAKDKILDLAYVLLPEEIAAKLAANTKVLYAPIDNKYFKIRNQKAINQFKKLHAINPHSRIISYHGRLFSEKGVSDLIRAFRPVKKNFPDAVLVIAGDGLDLTALKELVFKLKTPDIIFTGALSDPIQKRALMQMSYLGVIPSKPVGNIVETLCVGALEYQASGCVLLTTKVGGIHEAAGNHSLYAKHSNPSDLARKITMVLEDEIDRDEIIKKGFEHTAKFNYLKITRKFLEMVSEKREQVNSSRVIIKPEFWLGTNLKPYGRRYKI